MEQKISMELTNEERSILNGDKGVVLQKILKSIVYFGEAFDSEKLVSINGDGHFVMSAGVSVLKPLYRMLDEIISADLKATNPFTADPRPVDFSINHYSSFKNKIVEKNIFKLIFGSQDKLEKQLKSIGLRDSDSFSCACYLPEVGNIPEKGSILAWAESSAVVYANSVLGARTNRNSGGIDILCNVMGKVPYFGLLTDDGRKADWLINVSTDSLPNPQILGSAVGMKVVEDVPYITGLDKFLDGMSENKIKDYLKDMGAASASNGAVGLFHVDKITPEALESGKELLRKNHKKITFSEEDLEKVSDSYPVLWKNKNAKPVLSLIGCPHLSLDQLNLWSKNIQKRLKEKGKNKITVETILTAPPAVVKKFMANKSEFKKFNESGLQLTSFCPLAYMNNPVCSRRAVITNSNKLRTYSTARFYNDESVLEQITG